MKISRKRHILALCLQPLAKKKKMLSLDSCLKAMLCWSIHVWKGILTRRWRGGLSSRGECCAHLAGRASSAPCRGAGQQFKNQLGPPSIT